METMQEILRHYHFSPADEENLKRLGEILLPESDRLAEAFYDYLAEDPYTAGFFPTEASARRRRETLKTWFQELFTAPYDERYLRRLQRVGKTHVRIGLRGHHVNAAMNFVRSFCTERLATAPGELQQRVALQETLDKALDINLDVLTGSYREEELKTVFLSRRVESALILWAERLVRGLNLLLVVGLLLMAGGITGLFVEDIYEAFTGTLETGVIKALGSLLILWMMIELLHAEIRYLRGGQFQVVVFVELALVAFIRKLFIAALEKTDPLNFGLLLAGLLVLGVLFFTTQKRPRQV